MRTFQVSAGGRVDAPVSLVYAIIADYRHHHPRIVPPKYFTRLDVLQGGAGSGTRTRVEMRILGRTRVFEQVVSEPEPGRIVMESNTDGSGVTTFTVEPTGDASTQVTIATEITMRPGLQGAVERLVASLLLPRIYKEELSRLAEYAESLV